MKFYTYSQSTQPLPYRELLEQDLKVELLPVTEIPKTLGMHEMLIVHFDKVEMKDLELFRQQTYQYLAVVNDINSNYFPFIMRSGGTMILSFPLQTEVFKNILSAVIEEMKLKDIAHHLAHKELSLLRRIYRLANADKKLLSEDLFGVSSDSTFDVSLARLRKKLADPEVGDDFFRIITKKGRLYLVNALLDYEISEVLLNDSDT